MPGGYTDHGVPGLIGDCVDHRLVCNTFSEVVQNRRRHAPLLDPVLREIDLRDRNGTATPCSVHEGNGAGFAAANSHRVRRVRHNAGIEYDPGEVVEPRYENVRLAAAGSSEDLSLLVDIESRDVTLVVGDWGGHARQA